MSDEPEPREEDFRAADLLLRRMKNAPAPGTSSYDAYREFYASMHAAWGPDKFALRFGLRSPRNWLEELQVLHFRGQITDAEFRLRAKKHAIRPVDRAMLEEFFGEHDAKLEQYAQVLRLIVQIATDQHEPDCWQTREREVDAAIEQMDEKFRLTSDELKTVYEFLTQIQAERADPIKCGDFTGDSAHWITALVLSRTSEGWQECKRIAERSRTQDGYLYSTHASFLFFRTWIEPKALPLPNDLAALMRSERAKALERLDRHATSTATLNSFEKARAWCLSHPLVGKLVLIFGVLAAVGAFVLTTLQVIDLLRRW